MRAAGSREGGGRQGRRAEGSRLPPARSSVFWSHCGAARGFLRRRARTAALEKRVCVKIRRLEGKNPHTWLDWLIPSLPPQMLLQKGFREGLLGKKRNMTSVQNLHRYSELHYFPSHPFVTDRWEVAAPSEAAALRQKVKNL